MKKFITFVLVGLCLGSGAFASEKVGPEAKRHQHRQEMKKIKQQMRENRANNPASKEPSKADLFWKKEAERSGLGNTGDRMGNFLKNLNPMPFFKQQNEQYKARKAQGQG